MIAEVLVEIKAKNIDKTFSYLIPKDFKEKIKVGIRVLVPFGKQKLEGFVLKIKELIDSTITFFTVDDLKYLYRGGRVSAAEKVVGGMLNIKPILIVDKEGRLVPIDKARGLKKVYKKFVEMVEKETDKDISKDQLVIIGHSDSLQSALDFKEILESEMGFTNIYIDEIGPVISSHSGPGTLMFSLLKKNIEEGYMNIKM